MLSLISVKKGRAQPLSASIRAQVYTDSDDAALLQIDMVHRCRVPAARLRKFSNICPTACHCHGILHHRRSDCHTVSLRFFENGYKG